MKKASRKIWLWILSGLALLMGGLSQCTIFETPKVYGPPPVTPSDTTTMNHDTL